MLQECHSLTKGSRAGYLKEAGVKQQKFQCCVNRYHKQVDLNTLKLSIVQVSTVLSLKQNSLGLFFFKTGAYVNVTVNIHDTI